METRSLINKIQNMPGAVSWGLVLREQVINIIRAHLASPEVVWQVADALFENEKKTMGDAWYHPSETLKGLGSTSAEPWINNAKVAIESIMGDASQEGAGVETSADAALQPSPASASEICLLDPDMPAQELRLHMGELTANEVRVARAAIAWANTRQCKPVLVSLKEVCEAYHWNNATVERGIKAVLDAAGVKYVE